MAANYKVFVDGERLPEGDLNNFLAKQCVVQVDGQNDLAELVQYGVRMAITVDTGEAWLWTELGGWAKFESDGFLTQDDADARYLTRLTAEGLFLSLEDSADFLTGDEIASTYLAKLTAQGLYLSQVDASQNYLGKTEASTTYLTQLTAQGLYLTQTDASNTYITELTAGTLFISKGSAATDINNNSTTINGGKITTGTIAASAISAGTLTGFTIQTSSSGRRVLISGSSNSAVFYNDNGTESFRLSGSSGSGGIYDASALHSFQVGGSTILSMNSSGIAFASAKGINSDLPVQGGVNATSELTAGSYVRSGINLAGGYATLHSNGGISSTYYTSTSLNPGRGEIKSERSMEAGTTMIVGTMTGSSTNPYVRWGGGALNTNTSDRRVKENIVTIADGLDIVNQLNPVTFDSLIDDTDKRIPGFIAQEVEEVSWNEDIEVVSHITGAVVDIDIDETEGPLKTFNYDTLIPYLTKAIQELSAKNDVLEARLAVLEGGNS